MNVTTTKKKFPLFVFVCKIKLIIDWHAKKTTEKWGVLHVYLVISVLLVDGQRVTLLIKINKQKTRNAWKKYGTEIPIQVRVCNFYFFSCKTKQITSIYADDFTDDGRWSRWHKIFMRTRQKYAKNSSLIIKWQTIKTRCLFVGKSK